MLPESSVMARPPLRSYTEKFKTPDTWSLTTLGVIHSPHTQRFGAPRQPSAQGEPGQVKAEGAKLILNEKLVVAEMLHDLEGFERIWLIGAFHLNQGYKAKPTPPRGPKIPRGLYATRAPHRPNGLSLSCCELVKVEGHVLHLGTLDFLDGTPIFDIKPYLPYADAFPESRAGWVDSLDPNEPPRR